MDRRTFMTLVPLAASACATDGQEAADVSKQSATPDYRGYKKWWNDICLVRPEAIEIARDAELAKRVGAITLLLEQSSPCWWRIFRSKFGWGLGDGRTEERTGIYVHAKWLTSVKPCEFYYDSWIFGDWVEHDALIDEVVNWLQNVNDDIRRCNSLGPSYEYYTKLPLWPGQYKIRLPWEARP